MNYAYLLLLFLFVPGLKSHVSQEPNVTEEEKTLLIERHNYWRAEVGLGPLEWSDEMALLADDWARQLKAQGCKFKHRPKNKFGENLFWGTEGYYTAGDAVDSWGEEKSDYNYNTK